MGYTLNVDHWDWVNPETQKVTRLRRGDEVPAEVLDNEGIDIDVLSDPNTQLRPMFLKGEDSPAPASSASEAGRASGEKAGVRSSSPQVTEK